MSTIKPSYNNESWLVHLFSDNILNNQSKIDLIDIYFARANILDKKNEFIKASNCLEKANTLTRELYGSNFSEVQLRIEKYDQIYKKNKIESNQTKDFPTPIFIVGMPRSGKTITESILSCNNQLIKYGENNSLGNSIKIFFDSNNNLYNQSLYKLYIDNLGIEDFSKAFVCSTSPINFVYTGLLASKMSNAKIIFCYRNPLDNIKEIYKKHFGWKHSYSTSINEIAVLYIESYLLMLKYKNRYNSQIYFQNYDNLVSNKEDEIKNLINWLGWEYDKKYLEPKLDSTTLNLRRDNPRTLTKDDLNSWKNYRELLQPAIEIFKKNEIFQKFLK